ncbi:MAG: Excinuclease subunit domain protein [Anaerocolumna sp.]|nr:Excinuclease subunit domain protein [Anaerocolumna sp.]
MLNSNDLSNKLKNIPQQPGIYKMLDAKGTIIYIGKSKCLKKRVKSYFVKSPKWEKVKKLVSFIHDIEYVVTDTHLEARLLECELIKFHMPVFNSQLKNDQRYCYLKVENSYNKHNNVLSVVKYREENTFGPFRSSYNLNTIIDLLKNIYPISKSKRTFHCEYHLLPIYMDQQVFQENKLMLLELLGSSAKITNLIKQLEKRMKEAALAFRYETASMYRDIIQGLGYIRYGIDGYQKLLSKDILLKIPTESGEKLFFVSGGTILIKEIFFHLTHENLSDFIHRGQALKPTFTNQMNEKMKIDFRDILYSEINSLPENMVFYLDNVTDYNVFLNSN